jgi:hypothetical protein
LNQRLFQLESDAKKRHMILLSDMLLLTKPRAAGALSLKTKIPLNHCWLLPTLKANNVSSLFPFHPSLSTSHLLSFSHPLAVLTPSKLDLLNPHRLLWLSN